MLISAKFTADRLLAAWRKLFHEHLLATNILISTVMGAAADTTAQYYEKLYSKDKTSQDSESCNLVTDTKRTFHMSVAGMTTGVVSHYWYVALDRWLPGRTAKILIKKVVADQLVYSPVCLGTFFVTLAVLGGTDRQAFKEEIANKGSTIYLVDCIVWPPVQAFNYGVLSRKYRVMFDNIVSFGFCIFTSYITYKNPDTTLNENETIFRNENETKFLSRVRSGFMLK